MSNEPFTREPGWDYRQNRGKDLGETAGWDVYSTTPINRWISPSMAYFADYGPGMWFRRRLPAAPLADGWVKITGKIPRLPAWFLQNGKVWLEVEDASEGQAIRRPPGMPTHWMPAHLPAPPQAPSREELDEQAFEAWIKTENISRVSVNSHIFKDAFLAGVRHGRDGK